MNSLPTNSASTTSIPPAQSILEGAKDCIIKNNVLTNVQGNAVMFRFDGPPTEEFNTLFTQHMAGLVTVEDLDKKMKKHGLNQAIRDLPRAKAAYNDFTSSKRRRTICFADTRQALLEEIALHVTRTDGPRAYFLFGIAGIGKSTIAQTVTERADNLRLLGASFFFSRDEAERSTAEKFFTSIAFQLCAYDKQFAAAIGAVLTEEQGAAAMSRDPQEQLTVLIVEPLRDIVRSRSLPTVIVVDALDECDADDGSIILMGLSQLVQDLPSFKIVLTTRPQPHIQDILDILGAHQLFRMEDIEGKVVERDIQLYLQYSLSPDQVRIRLPRLRQKWAANEEEINALVRAAGVLFIIASTAILYILDKAACNPGSRMKALQDELARNRTPFNTLNDFYTVILRSAVSLGCERDIVKRYQAVVGAIVLIEDPLPVGALANLIDMAEDDAYCVLDNLQSVISLGSNGVPLLYHKSFPDYIIDDQRCQDADLRITPKDHHTRLATCCLRIMNRHLKRNILGLSGPAQYFDNEKALEEEKLSKDDVQQAIPSELQYACAHWASHLAQADLQDGQLATEFKMFVQKQLLHWLEALSWIRKFGISYRSLDVALKHQIMGTDMHQIFSDTIRFVSRDYQKIEQSALYIYHSALPSTPIESPLYKNYQHEVLLCQVVGGPTQWDIKIAEHQHDRCVNHIQFAKDGSRFASWSVETVKLWDATSGTPIGTLYGGMFLADDFSVFAGAEGRLATIHSVSSCAPITSFNHSAKVVRMAISFDGSRLAAGLESGIVRVWDVATRASVADLDCYHFDGYRFDSSGQLAFSPSGYMLAFTSEHAVRLWKGAVAVAGLEHEAQKPVKIIFSGDGTRIATLSKKKKGPGILVPKVDTLRLWNSENGMFLAVLKDVGNELAISVDGSLVATGGMYKEELQLWSGDSLTLVDTIPIKWISSLLFSGDMLAIASRGHNIVTLYDVKNRASIAELELYNPICLAFSPDGTRLAAGYNNHTKDPPDDTICLWDVPSIRACPKQQLSPVTALELSPDCSRLASGRDNGCVELWDTGHMGQPIACHSLHSDWITVLAFSPDGDQLASGSNDKTVMFWGGRDDTQTGVLEHSFPDSLTSLAFSSSLLAAATLKAITFWDRTSLHLIHTFEQGSDLLSFSPDGSVIATSLCKGSHVSVLEVLDTEKLIVAETFIFYAGVIRLLFSPDGSQIVAQCRTPGPYKYNDGFQVLDLINKAVISDPKNESFSWFPHLNGIPIFWCHDFLAGRFSARHNRSSMFVLGCKDGRILLIQPPTSR